MIFFALGINHKTCPVEIREKLHFKTEQSAHILRSLKSFQGISELVILSTCNRVEFYGTSEGPSIPEEALAKIISQSHGLSRDSYAEYLYRYEGKDVMRHLFRVVCGLDSLVVGENEILGQIRDAFMLANEAGSVSGLLYRLMEKALKVGKQVRTDTKINQGAVSIPSVAVELAEKIFGKLSDEKVMVLGTGEMSQMTLKSLKAAGAQVEYVVSRHQDRGMALASEYHACFIPYTDWHQGLEKTDILIASTSAPHPIVRKIQIEEALRGRGSKPLFIIDIAVPRNVEADVNQLEDVYLYNIDDLQSVSDSNLKRRRKEITSSEQMIEKAVLDYQGWMEQLKARPVLEQFETFLNEILEHELGRMRTLSDQNRQELKHRIRSKLLHPPFEKIKEASYNGGVTRYLEALHSLFDLKKGNRQEGAE